MCSFFIFQHKLCKIAIDFIGLLLILLECDWMPGLTLKLYQEYLEDVYKNRKNDQGLFIKLVEEIGEVAEQISIRDGRKDGDKEAVLEELGKELADVIHYTIAIAGVNGIDLEKVILEKDLSAAIKYQHSTNLMEYIEQTAKYD